MKKQNVFIFFILLLTVSMFTISCGDDTITPIVEEDKNELANDKVDGEWDITSLRIDGEEYVGFLFQKATMEFDADTKAATGDTSWELIDNDGITTIISGAYEIKNEGEELELDGDSFKLDVSSSSLNLEGNIDGEYWEIQSDSK